MPDHNKCPFSEKEHEINAFLDYHIFTEYNLNIIFRYII